MAHSFGPTCSERKPQATESDGLTPSTVKAQFFYISSVPIDDPLSPVPPVYADKAAVKLRPFSSRDNAALEEAWQSFLKDQEPPRPSVPDHTPRSAKARLSFIDRGNSPHPSESLTEGPEASHKAGAGTNMRINHNELVDGDPDGNLTFSKPASTSSAPSNKPSQPHSTQPEKMSEMPSVMLSQDPEGSALSTKPITREEIGLAEESRDKPRSRPQKDRFVDADAVTLSSRAPVEGVSTNGPGGESTIDSQFIVEEDSDISRRPFARAPSNRDVNPGNLAAFSDGAKSDEDADSALGETDSNSHNVPRQRGKDKRTVFVPVGLSRLHLVEFPALVMKPIYWSPINDRSHVIRATWFYDDTKMPVPAELANRLELGYEDLKPYLDVYQQELQACIENGAAAEEKLVYKLWPEEKNLSRPGTAQSSSQADTEELDAETVVLNMVQPENRMNAAADLRKSQLEETARFKRYGVIYLDQEEAQLLKSSLQPSESRKRRVVHRMKHGHHHIGIVVRRGFDRNAWLEKYPDPKLTRTIAQARVGGYISQSGDATTQQRRMSCGPCDEQRKLDVISDLVLVIHGIGQKLSERVDSFHFTHAINGLRREFNVALVSETMKGTIREDTAIMALPVNWRLTLSFDDQPGGQKSASQNAYQLADITPDSLPAIRSLITDVMLDIPYYMSHHKQKMISAVAREANRVYRLWCLNNPGFREHGRVHLVAHSLGSAMAMDILSQQPTEVPKDLDLTNSKVSDKMFEFDTTNLFLCGSPSGFFLLLNGANLVPRKGLNKRGMENEDRSPGIAGEAGYGCLAVQNIYNILHRNDPISYQLNACVDKEYAASLASAVIPSASSGFLSKVGSFLRLSSSSAPANYGTVVPQRPAMPSLPSTVELETRNFTREEIAEKRMYLLNDNGQIDYILNPSGGPLEIQYLDMLGAHSSYWILQDFANFLVLEIGREPGKDRTNPALQARKKRTYKRGSIG